MVSPWLTAKLLGWELVVETAVAGQGLPQESVDLKGLLMYLAPLPCFPYNICSLLGPQGSFGDAGPAGAPVSIFSNGSGLGKGKVGGADLHRGTERFGLCFCTG